MQGDDAVMGYVVRVEQREDDSVILRPSGDGLMHHIPVTVGADPRVMADQIARWLDRAYEAGRRAKATEVRKVLGVQP